MKKEHTRRVAVKLCNIGLFIRPIFNQDRCIAIALFRIRRVTSSHTHCKFLFLSHKLCTRTFRLYTEKEQIRSCLLSCQFVWFFVFVSSLSLGMFFSCSFFRTLTHSFKTNNFVCACIQLIILHAFIHCRCCCCCVHGITNKRRSVFRIVCVYKRMKYKCALPHTNTYIHIHARALKFVHNHTFTSLMLIHIYGQSEPVS